MSYMPTTRITYSPEYNHAETIITDNTQCD